MTPTQISQIAFYFFAGLAVLGAILTVTVRNVVHSAIFLITSLLATAGIFLTLGAQFLFAVQIILYVGGIMVLFIFVIMLVNLDVALHQLQFNRQKWVAGLLALVLGSQLGVAIWFARAKGSLDIPSGRTGTLSPQNVEQFGLALFEKYALPFEIASVLLLVALIGAVVMTKKRI
ncbi:MAG: NADH-quinone oxidoreductase subunit J [Acidobacteria bacterium]|nr:NADH-quinone oxidoreductase subunit J [Acidobacteriota bacterium]MBI3662468.1 NADH-quinone oxidoreductase subunit J [Acidobacteriota bacterium]